MKYFELMINLWSSSQYEYPLLPERINVYLREDLKYHLSQSAEDDVEDGVEMRDGGWLETVITPAVSLQHNNK